MGQAFDSRILRIAYIKTSALATALGITINEGDLITDAMITGQTLAWQQLAVAGDLSEHAWSVEPLIQEQFTKYVRDGISSIGFEKPEGNITLVHYPTFSTTHKTMLESSFGKFIASAVQTDTVTGDVTDSLTVTQSASVGLDDDADGHFVQIGNNIAVVESVVGDTITLKTRISAKDGDAITLLGHWDLDIVDDDSYILFVETARGSRLISHVRFGLDFETPKDDILKMKLNYQGDVALKSTLSWDDLETTGTIAYESNSKDHTTTNFKKVVLGSVPRLCASSFNFKLTREMTRLGCQATESGNGNGGTQRDRYMTELEVQAYDALLEDDYDANNYVTLLAQKPDFAIFAPVAQIRSENPNVINDNVESITYMIAANVGQSGKTVATTHYVDPTKMIMII